MFEKPTHLCGLHSTEDFDSGSEQLDSWLKRHALQADGAGSARTFVLTESGKKEVCGYYSLTVGQVDSVEAPHRVAKGMGRYPIPVILLARLAVHRDYQKKGIGCALLKDAVLKAIRISDSVGIRAMLVHPIDEGAAAFYAKFGFIPSPIREGQLLLLLKDAKKAFGIS